MQARRRSLAARRILCTANVSRKRAVSALPETAGAPEFSQWRVALLKPEKKTLPTQRFAARGTSLALELNRTPMRPSNPLNASFRKLGSRTRRPPINGQPSPRTRGKSRTNRCTSLDSRKGGSFDPRRRCGGRRGEACAVDAHAVDAQRRRRDNLGDPPLTHGREEQKSRPKSAAATATFDRKCARRRSNRSDSASRRSRPGTP